MKKPIPPKSQLVSKLGNLRAADVAALSKMSSIDTTTVEFGRVFKENPVAALAMKGIVINASEAVKLNDAISGMAGRQGNLAADGVTVGVTVKFG
jgi:hypothetical protein